MSSTSIAIVPSSNSTKSASTLSSNNLLTLMNETHIPGMSIAYSDGMLSHYMELGVTDKSLNPSVNVHADTVFRAASLSKPVFAYLILKLAQHHKFNLKQPLCEILKHERLSENEYSKDLTAEWVLSHQTGLPNMDTDDFQFKPGTEYRYSGAAYLYLQKVIEKKYAKTLEELAQELVFKPLGMKHSSFCRPKNFTTAVSHNEKMEPQPLPADQDDSPAIAANSLHTTARDYARFITTWMNDKELEYAFDPAVSMTKDEWARRQQVSNADLEKITWGLGWGLQETSDGTIAFHWGDMGDSKAFVAMNLKKSHWIVYFTNSHNGLSIARDIASSVVGDLDPGFNYLFKKYGFEHHDVANWEIKQKRQTWQNFAKYEICDKPAWQKKNLLTINYNETKCTLSIKCDPTNTLFAKIIRNEFDAFKSDNKMEDTQCTVRTEANEQGNILSLTINIPEHNLYNRFIEMLKTEKLLPTLANTPHSVSPLSTTASSSSSASDASSLTKFGLLSPPTSTDISSSSTPTTAASTTTRITKY